MGWLYASSGGAGLLLSACAPDPIPGPEIAIVAHQMDSCALPDELLSLELQALGDFDASPRTSDIVDSDQTHTTLAFPAATLAISAAASFERSSERFSGFSEYRSGSTLPLLLWPQKASCALDGRSEYPSAGGGQGLGYSRALSLLMLAGSDASQSAAVSGALVFDAGTGDSYLVPPGNAQLREPRAFASVTEFGPGFLVAGGEDPTLTFPSGSRRLHASAEVYVAEEGRFDPARSLDLLQSRSRHAAIALDPHHTLLVGGITTTAGEQEALRALELLDSETGFSYVAGQLSLARIAPTALLLSDGSIFVAGGVDALGAPVPGAERFVGNAADGYQSVWFDESLFAGRSDQAFVAMAGGAVLVAGGCEQREAPSEECQGCRAGCEPEAGWDGYWIDADNDVVQFTLGIAAPRPRLLAATDGAPLFVAEAPEPSAGAEAARLLRFDPWSQAFQSLGELEQPPALERPTVNLDAGAVAWVSDAGDGSANLIGRRFSTRNPFTQDLELITLTSETNPGWPLHLAPGQGTQAGSGASAKLVPREDPRAPGLVLQLQEGASVWITDTRYADFRLEVALEAGKAPALLAEAPNGRVSCRWPAEADGSELTLEALRTGAELVLTAGEHESSCELGDARVALGLGSRADDTELARWSVHRSGE